LNKNDLLKMLSSVDISFFYYLIGDYMISCCNQGNELFRCLAAKQSKEYFKDSEKLSLIK